MRWGVWIGVGAVGVLGGVLAATLLWIPPPLPDTPAPDADRPEAVPGAAANRSAAPAETPRPERRSRTPDGLDPDGLAPALRDLHPTYEAALDRDGSQVQVPRDTPPQEADRLLTEALYELVSNVQGAADEHLAYAETAPRAEAAIARGRAAQLYDHLAQSIRELPLAPGLPPAQRDIQRTTRERMAEAHARRAAQIRAEGP